MQNTAESKLAQTLSLNQNSNPILCLYSTHHPLNCACHILPNTWLSTISGFRAICRCDETSHGHRKTNFGDRALALATPATWNRLPVTIWPSDTLQNFKNQWKAHFFCLFHSSRVRAQLKWTPCYGTWEINALLLLRYLNTYTYIFTEDNKYPITMFRQYSRSV